jgi:hypothetical protein
MSDFDDLANESANAADNALAAREAELLSQTTIDWAAMRPQIGSEEDYQILMAQVNEATARNETVGSVLRRLRDLGQSGVALAEKVRGLVPT